MDQAKCPIISEFVAFLRYATNSEIAEYQRIGLVAGVEAEFMAARAILEQEKQSGE